MTAQRRTIAGAVLLLVVATVGIAVPGTIAATTGQASATDARVATVDGGLAGVPVATAAGGAQVSRSDATSARAQVPPNVGPPGDSVREQIQTDIVRIGVSVAESGDADWRIEYWTRLDDDNVTEAFQSLQSDIQGSPVNYTRRFAERIRPTVADAANATGREMNASGFAVSAEIRTIPQEYGVITYSFEWSNFAVVEDGGDRIEAGDAIDGLFLDRKTRLTIEWPEGYEQVEATPEPDDSGERAAVWRGESTEFVTGEPRVVVERSAGTADPGTTTGGGDDGATDGDGDGGTDDGATDGDGDGGTDDGGEAGGGGLPLAMVGAAVLVVLAAVAGIAWWRSGGSLTAVTGNEREGASEADGRTSTADDGASPADGDDSAESPPDTTDEDDGAEPAPAPVDDELLSNEERVLRLLERQGGRMKQQEIVEELDWTEAKTSQVVSGLRESGEVETFRLGRENVLTLPDEDES